MKIAFLHYHLRPGGVTSVIRHQVAALKGYAQTMVIASSLPDNPIDTQVVPLAQTGYDLESIQPVDGEILATTIWEAIHTIWPEGCDVLHVHNPTLVKNRALNPALSVLRDRGLSMFLQIHDFAEDGRPSAFDPSGYVENVHYGTINSRDYQLLIQAGLKSQGLHMIVNMVEPFTGDSGTDTGFVLYPVRAIRRKNIGEAILLSMFLPAGIQIGITMPPLHSADLRLYRGWQDFVKQHRLPVAFEVARQEDFIQLVSKARFMISTSLNEGFGFSFLEPWTAGKEVFGRHLSHVCDDFKQRGIILDHLYSALRVPLKCFDVAAFQRRWHNSLLSFSRTFGQILSTEVLQSGFAAITFGRTIDFGYLDEEFQKRVIKALLQNKTLQRDFLHLNSYLLQLDQFEPDDARISRNKDGVLRHFGMETYRSRLLEIYQQVQEKSVTQRIDQKELLRFFLRPENYYMPKWRSPGEP